MIAEIEEEDRLNRKARLTTARAEAVFTRNDVFDPAVLKQWLSGNLGSVSEIIKATYYNTLDA